MPVATYKVSFTTGGLYYREAIRIIPLYCVLKDWHQVRSKILDENLLQSRTKMASQRTLRELLPRLQTLTEDQMRLIAGGSRRDQNQILWLSVCKQYPLVREFAIEVLREKFFCSNQAVGLTDFDTFFFSKAEWHQELGNLTEMTMKKLRQVLFRMMREAELISMDGKIIFASLSPAVARAIIRDDASLYMVFPVSEADFRRQAAL